MSRSIYFGDLQPRHAFTSASRTITEADVATFAELSGDFNPLHLDEQFAAASSFGRRVAHGMLVAAISTGLRSEIDKWAIEAFLGTSRRFVAPTFLGDTIHVEYRLAAVRPSQSLPMRGVVTVTLQVVKREGVVVQKGEDVVLVAIDPSTSEEGK